MTAIRHTLQKDLFEPDDERLVNVIHVIGHGRKRKPYFLCFTVTSQHPITLRLYQVKQGERNNTYTKKRVWFLRDVKVIDGINPRKPTSDFELTVDKPYRFTVTNATEKDAFIRQLYKLTAKYLPAQRPEFINVSIPVEELELMNHTQSNGVTNGSGTGAGIESVSQQGEEEAEEYQPITAKEEQDFRRLLQKCQMTIGEAEKFAEHLNRELSTLDGANIQAIMGGEMQIAELMNKIDQAIERASTLEETLDSYDALLAHVREGVETMEEKDKLLRTHANNRRLLMDELQSFVTLLDMSPDHQQTLADCNLSDSTKITRAAQAAMALQKCMKAKVPQGTDKLKAYSDQMKLYQRISDQFAERLVAHLSALFRNLASNDNGWGSTASQGPQLSLPRHDYIHAPLKPFSDLIMWLKHSVPDGYKMLMERYLNAFKEVYRKEFVTFFDLAKQHVRISTFERKPTLKSSQTNEMSRMVRSPSIPMDGGNMVNEMEQFRSLIELILKEIEPVVVAEQMFCIWWFHISSDIMTSMETQSIASSDSGSTGGAPERRLERQFNDQVRAILGQLFEHLDAQLQEFVAHCERANPAYLMQLLALLSNRAIAIQDSGIYLSIIFGKISVIVKRKFDVFMEAQMQLLGDIRVLKKAKIGVLDNLKLFEDLSQQAESAFKGSERRGDLDRWYPPILAAVIEAIERAAEDPNSKSPPAVVRMENYHYLFSALSQLKITCVEQQRKDAKQRYQSSLDAYVKEYMGKPMEKLQNFFEEIETCIEQGMKPEEIGYQQAFNKQELRKAVAAYPVKEVSKGLDNLYRKIQKHLSSGESLLQVVWRNMQDEFIQQYKHYEQLIGQCYPNSNIQLDFSIQDVLQCFSDIAQQH